MPRINIDNINTVYARVKGLGRKAMVAGRYAECLDHFDMAAYIASRVNSIYKDDEIEEWLAELSDKLICKADTPYSPVKNRFVFYDQIGLSSVLALQYIRGLISMDAEILYVLESKNTGKARTILEEMETYGKGDILILPEDPAARIDNIQEIYEYVRRYGAEKVILHSPAEGSFGVVLWSALPEVTRYRIVPGDHHFYLGVNITDYAIEYRPFGLCVAVDKRGFTADRLFCQPYYPAITESQYLGLPEGIGGDRIIVFSGGASYKTYDGKNTYYNLVKYLFDSNDKVVFLYAGKKDNRHIIRLKKKNKYKDRVFWLGYRNDLFELMKHIDIYLGTYPVTGGLMTQYAAICSKPVLQFYDGNPLQSIESVIPYGEHGAESVTCTDMDSFRAYAGRLVNDKAFREEEGRKMNSRMVTPEVFNQNLERVLRGEKTHEFAPLPLPEEEYTAHFKMYLDMFNLHTNPCLIALTGRYGFRVFGYFPGFVLKSCMVRSTYKDIVNRFKDYLAMGK